MREDYLQRGNRIEDGGEYHACYGDGGFHGESEGEREYVAVVIT